MSIFLQKEIENKGQLGLWAIDEGEIYFKSKLPLSHYDGQIEKYRHQTRRLEWLAGRFLLYKMSDGKRCSVDKYGKPFLEHSAQNISISHSGNYAAVVMSKKIVGIDIQKITPKIKRIAHKFMRPEEQECLSIEKTLEHLHVFWGAKEALYKAYGKKELDFREHISVTPFDYNQNASTTKGAVIKGDYNAEFLVSYQKFKDYILVYVTKE